MSLTLNTSPANISNSGAFNITTDLVEDGTHVNLRVRADITVAAVVIASVEKPKGLADFDFADILKSSVTGISFARDSGNLYAVSGGSPLVAYSVLFTEVYESATGVTTTGDTDGPTSRKYVPAKGDGISFVEYVLHDEDSRFANVTLRNNITKFYTYNPTELWLTFFTEVVHVELFYSKDGVAYDHATHFDPTNGWGVIIINIGELMATVTSNLRIYLGEVGGIQISEVITIYPDTSQIDERVVLEFDGLVGGKEYLAFEGLKDLEFTTVRSYYTTSKKNRKPILFTGINRQRIESRYKDMANAEYLKSLLISDNVKKLLPSYASPTDVTILTDSVTIDKGREFFTNRLDIEYEY
jgi:hypothetical protein